MTTKTDLASVTLTSSEITTCHGHSINPLMIMAEAKQQATELANLLGELLKAMPSGTNKTTLTTIQSNLL